MPLQQKKKLLLQLRWRKKKWLLHLKIKPQQQHQQLPPHPPSNHIPPPPSFNTSSPVSPAYIPSWCCSLCSSGRDAPPQQGPHKTPIIPCLSNSLSALGWVIMSCGAGRWGGPGVYPFNCNLWCFFFFCSNFAKVRRCWQSSPLHLVSLLQQLWEHIYTSHISMGWSKSTPFTFILIKKCGILI